MNDGIRGLVDNLYRNGRLLEEEYGELIRFRDPETVEYLYERAGRVRERQKGKTISVLGTIDLTSYCKNDCFYCGLRRENRFAHRYRMTEKEVVDCCKKGLDKGVTRFLLQGGDDLQYTPAQIAHIIAAMKELSPEAVIILSLGEKSRSVYQKWKAAGAAGYLLCQETAQDIQYKRIHPANMSLLRRKQCLWELKELGFMVGSGFMVGTPYQRINDLAKEFAFYQQLMPQMLMMGPFLPVEGTPFEQERNGTSDLTCFVIAILRLLFPDVTLSVAQTLEYLDKDGALHGVQAGADMILTDLTPEHLRGRYHPYKKRMQRGSIGVEDLEKTRKQLWEEGYEVVTDAGSGW
jgi:biotin synthase